MKWRDSVVKVRKCKNENCEVGLSFIRPDGLRNFCSMFCKNDHAKTKRQEYKKNLVEAEKKMAERVTQKNG